MIDFESIFRKHWPDVLRFALYLCGNRAEAEDLAASAFYRAWSSSAPVRLPTVKSYLLTIVRNLHRDRLRSASRRLNEPVGEATDPRPSPGDQAIQRDDLAHTLMALQRLDEDDRALIAMAALAEMSHAQIAASLGISVAAVKVRLHRARLRLHEILRNSRSVS